MAHRINGILTFINTLYTLDIFVMDLISFAITQTERNHDSDICEFIQS